MNRPGRPVSHHSPQAPEIGLPGGRAAVDLDRRGHSTTPVPLQTSPLQVQLTSKAASVRTTGGTSPRRTDRVVQLGRDPGLAHGGQRSRPGILASFCSMYLL